MFVALPRLRAWMLTHRAAYAARDAVWRDLVTRARSDGPQWVIAAIGMAMPALVRFAGGLARGYRGDPDDLDAEIVTGFLDALRSVDLDAGRLHARLCWAGFRAGIAARNADNPYLLVGDVEQLSGAAPHLPYGHPDLIVARAVAAGVIDRDDADLIVASRLDRTPSSRSPPPPASTDPCCGCVGSGRSGRWPTPSPADMLSGAISDDARNQIRRRAAARAAARAA